MERIIFNVNANTPWRRLLVIPIVAALFTFASVLAGAPGPAFAASGACPNAKALRNFGVSSNVAAGFSNNGNITTYWFSSLTDENAVRGVPGLIKYCVYPSPAQRVKGKRNIGYQDPTSIDVEATGANGAPWISREGFGNFSFGRPRGNPSNIPLDGTTTDMGTATWSTVPDDQTILLHINDPTVCANLYGGTSDTCFVKPSSPLASCDMGDTTLAYNAMPFGVVNCGPPSEAFEAQAVNEFGDEVQLAGTARELVSLSVSFNSYGCGVSGHWNTGDCVTTPGTTFTHPITANIYDTSFNLLATVTQDQTIEYRPSADPVNCTVAGGNDPAQWFNPDKYGGVGGCQYSIVKVLTFTFPAGTTLPDDVVWSVAFNTSHSGYTPIGEATACFGVGGGCGYDSLNVSTKSFTNAPYSGIDVVEDNVDMSWWSGGYPPSGSLNLLQSVSGWLGSRPLGAIITK